MLLDFPASKYVRQNKYILFINGSDSGIYYRHYYIREQTGRALGEQEGSMHRKEICTGRKHAQVRSMHKKEGSVHTKETCTGRKHAQEGSV